MNTKIPQPNFNTFGQSSLRNKLFEPPATSRSKQTSFHKEIHSHSSYKGQENRHVDGEENQYCLKNSRSSKAFKESTNSIYHRNIDKSMNKPTCSPSVSPLKHEKLYKNCFKNEKENSYSCKELVFLLKNEELCLSQRKQTLTKDTEDMEKQFCEYKQRINNTIDDLKLSIISCLYSQYNNSITQFKNIKTEYITYTNLKRQFWKENETNFHSHELQEKNNAVKYPGMINKNGVINNEGLVHDLISDIKDYKLHMNYKEFENIQEKVLKPLVEASKDLLKDMQNETNFDSDGTSKMLSKLHKEVDGYMRAIYGRLDEFVVNPNKERKQKEEKSQHQRENYLEITPNFEPRPKVNSSSLYDPKPFNLSISPIAPKIKQSEILLEEEIQSGEEIENIFMATNSKDKCLSTANTNTNTSNNGFGLARTPCSDNGYLSNFGEFGENNRIENKSTFDLKLHKLNSEIPTTSKPIKLQYQKSLSDKHTNQLPLVPETAICLILLSNNRIAVGTKAGNIKIFCTNSGSKLAQLELHTASLCSLAVINMEGKEYLLSGGDVGCCRIGVWDLTKYENYHTFSKFHFAAVTCIAPLPINPMSSLAKNIITGSFDKTLRMFNTQTCSEICHVSTEEKITMLYPITLSSLENSECMITGHLSPTLSLWYPCAEREKIMLMKKIDIGSIPISISIGRDRNYPLIATKDGSIIRLNSNFNKVENLGQINTCEELVEIDGVVMGCLKGGQFIGVEGVDGEIGVGGCLSYACGVSPKTAVEYVGRSKNGWSRGGRLFMPNHKNGKETEIRVWAFQSLTETKNSTH